MLANLPAYFSGAMWQEEPIPGSSHPGLGRSPGPLSTAGILAERPGVVLAFSVVNILLS